MTTEQEIYELTEFQKMMGKLADLQRELSKATREARIYRRLARDASRTRPNNTLKGLYHDTDNNRYIVLDKLACVEIYYRGDFNHPESGDLVVVFVFESAEHYRPSIQNEQALKFIRRYDLNMPAKYREQNWRKY